MVVSPNYQRCASTYTSLTAPTLKPHHDILLTTRAQFLFTAPPPEGAHHDRAIREIHELHDVPQCFVSVCVCVGSLTPT